MFDDDDINWIKSLICLKKCDFSLNEIKQYIKLCDEGESTINERKQMLINQRKVIEKKIQSLNEALNFIDYKTNLYDKLLSKDLNHNSCFSSHKTKEIKN